MPRGGDAPPAGGYVYDDEGRIALAVNVALAAGRPLLVRGNPGTGKSSLARDVAERFGWRYYEKTITSRTTARDLLWSFDAVRRLNDANAGGAEDARAYLTPEALWWAFSPGTARTRGLDAAALAERGLQEVSDPSPRPGERAVVLLDEIDKADPDLPNDLLIPLGALHFTLAGLEDAPLIEAETAPLVLITTNEERDLPRAFLRRCVVLALPDPGPERMLAVARAHFPDVSEGRLSEVLAAFTRVKDGRAPDDHDPGLAEYL